VTLSLRYAARTDVGLAREGNEDALYAGPRLLAVADGMGGHAAGEVASRVVIETLAPLDGAQPDGDVESALRGAVQTANAYLRDMVAADGALEGMGTTLTAFLWTGDQLALVHIGDSRAYLLRDGQMRQVTHDHTFVQTLIDEGRITPDEATTHPQRSWITNALDGRSDVHPDLSLVDVQIGDHLLVCSDGLSSYVSEQTISEAIAYHDPRGACDELVDLALRAGGLDNISCIVAEVIDEPGSAGAVAPDGEAAPIVAGAAAEPGPSPADLGRKDSPATRAAEIAPRHRRRSAPPPADTTDVETPRRRRSYRLVVVFVLILLIVIAAGIGSFFYVRTQYYVGVADGTPQTVGVYRGVNGKALGIDLDRLTARTNLPVQALPDYDRARVDDGIQADGKADALRIVGTLRSDACAIATPSPTARPATASPSASPRPRVSTSTARKRTARHRASPTPKPTPSLPAYCQATP
jgi:PPM family protein phosphatase